jgi:hypothetical protein
MPQEPLKITTPVANQQPVVVPSHYIHQALLLQADQNQVDWCAGCRLVLAAATEPWCPSCNGELQTVDLVAVAVRPEAL